MAVAAKDVIVAPASVVLDDNGAVRNIESLDNAVVNLIVESFALF